MNTLLHLPRDLFALVRGYRKPHRHALVAREYVSLPSDPDDAVTTTHKEPSAGIGSWLSVVAGSIVEHRQRPLVTAVPEIEQGATVALLEVVGAKNAKIGVEFHLSGGVSGGEIQIDHSTVFLHLRIDSQSHPTRETLVTAASPEIDSICKRGLMFDLDGHF